MQVSLKSDLIMFLKIVQRYLQLLCGKEIVTIFKHVLFISYIKEINTKQQM